MKPSGYRSEAELDALFSALADPTRRAILLRLHDGPAPVSELARPFDMSQPAVSKHLRVLEGAGLIRREAKGRERLAHLEAARLAEATAWLSAFRDRWDDRLGALEMLLGEMKQGKDDR